MKQLQLVKVEVQELVQGMYVAELDRPWLDSSFLLEGFLLQDFEQLAQLRALCEFVLVDASRSEAACQPFLLARAVKDAEEPAEDPARPAARRATASLVAEDATPRRRRADSHSFFEDFRTIVRESVRGKAPRPADERGITISRDAESGHAGTGGPQQAGPVDPAQPGTPARPQGGEDGADWMSSAGSVHADGDRRRAPSARRPKAVGLDQDADRENLAGSALIVPEGQEYRPTAQLEQAHRLYSDTHQLIGEFLEDARAHRVLDISKAETVISEMADSIQENPDPLRWLSHLKRKDDYAFAHAFDCAVHMMAFSQHLGYGRETKQVMGMAGLLIDLGKIRLPEDILRNRGRLNAAEYAEARKHVMHSIDILHTSPGISTKVLEVVAQHHERIDGSGYPYGLHGKEISPLAAVAGLVDSYAAMTSERVHAAPLPIHSALQALQLRSGRTFNAGLVEEFIQYVGIYPVGCLVELNTGEVGVVVKQNLVRRLKPTVMVLLDAQRDPLAYPVVVDLKSDPEAFPGTPYSIVRDLPPGSYALDPTEFYLQAA